MGRAKSSAQNDLGTEWSFETFLTNYDRWSPQAQKVVFGKEGTEKIADIARYASRLRDLGKSRNFSNTAQKYFAGAFIASVGTALWHGGYAQGAEAIASLAGTRIAASTFLATPVMRQWTASALKAMTSPAAPASNAALKSLYHQLPRIAQREPAIAGDVLDLHQRLSDAFGSSPTRLAADEGDDRVAVTYRQQGQDDAKAQRGPQSPAGGEIRRESNSNRPSSELAQ